jgi:hypothetical protein
MPIEIQAAKTARIVVGPLSGNGWNEVGVRCSADVWEKIAAGASNITVRLVSADSSATKIINVTPGSHKLWPVESFYYLFAIGGDRGTSATVEIAFPNAPAGITNAEILMLKTPSDTGL